MTFETWLALNQRPGESVEDAKKRYADEMGIDDPAEREGFVEHLRPSASYSFRPEDINIPYSQRIETPSPDPEEQYITDPDWLDQLKAGGYEAGAGVADFVAGPMAGWLPDEYEDYVREAAEEWGEEQQRKADLVARPQTREEILKEDPESLYQHLPEYWPTGHELARSAPPSLTPAAVGLGASLIGTPLLGAAGLTGFGLAAGSSAIAMTAGNLASSAYVSGEAYGRAKEDETVRLALGIDPHTPFKDLSPQDQEIVQGLAEDASQTSFGHRLYTSGLLEMMSFARYGSALFRWGMDVGLGASSEVWDNALYAEDVTDTLAEYGIPKEDAEEMRLAILNLGPSDKELWTKSLVQEGLYSGGFTTFESVVADKRVDGYRTASKKQQELKTDFIKRYNDSFIKSNEQKLLGTDTQQRKKDAQDAVARENNFESWEQMEATNKANIAELRELANNRTLEAREAAVRRANEIEEQGEQKKIEEQLEYAEKEVLEMERAAEESIRLARTDDYAATRKALEKERQVLDNIAARLPKRDLPVRKDGTLLSAEEMVGLNSLRIRRERNLMEYKKRLAALEKAEKKFAKRTDPALMTAEQKLQEKVSIKKEAKKQVKKRVLKSAVTGAIEGGVTVPKVKLEALFRQFQPKKDVKYVVLDKNDTNRLANILGGPEYLADAQGYLKDSEAFIIQGEDKVYLVADNIRGETVQDAISRAVEVGVFHEPIAHLGMRKTLGNEEFNAFLDRFYATNMEDINEWARTEVTPENVPAYLDKDYDPEKLRRPGLRQRLGLKKKVDIELSTAKKRELAEEFLAHKFTEYGVRDPHILERTTDALSTYFSSILGRDRASKVKAREMLASVQREYLGGKRNIITGDFFDPSNWVKSKPLGIVEEEKPEEKELTQKEKVKKYQEHLRKTKAKADVTEVAGEELLTEDVTAAKKAKGVRASKRRMTLREAQTWAAKTENQKGKGRRPRVPELQAIAERLRKGEATYEEYQEGVDKYLPIRKFETVPTPATEEEILGSINTRKYKEGLLVREANLGIDKEGNSIDEMVDVRLDIPAYEKFDTWVPTISRYPRKGTPKIYGSTAHLEDVTFKAPLPTAALEVAEGGTKTPFATMRGIWKGTSDSDLKKLADVRKNKSAWIQIGYNPEVQSSFYIKETKGKFTKGTPLASADEVIQIGGFVLAKNPVTKAVPTQVVDGKTIRFAKQKIKAYGGTAQVEANVLAALQANPNLAPLIKYMTPEELDLLTPKSADRMQATLEAREGIGIVPGDTGFDTEELISLALGGQIHKGWYVNSLGAINHVFGADAPRFIGLLAALSPQAKVEISTAEAADLWAAWLKAKRPTDKDKIMKIATKAISRFGGMRVLHGNTVRTLMAKDASKLILSGPKVQSFYKNLMGNLDEVTNDTWMWNAYGIMKNKIGALVTREGLSIKMPTYTISSAKLRETADMLTQRTGETWKPAEVQETIWSFYKALTEFSKSKARKGDRTLGEVAEQEDLTERIKEIPDFAQLLDGTAVPRGRNYAQLISNTLRKAGYEKEIESLSKRPIVSETERRATPTDRVRGLRKVGDRLEAQTKPKQVKRVRHSKKTKTLGVTGGDASLVEWADQGKWWNFGAIAKEDMRVLVPRMDFLLTSFMTNPWDEFGVHNIKMTDKMQKAWREVADEQSKKLKKSLAELEEFDTVWDITLQREGVTWDDLLVHTWFRFRKFETSGEHLYYPREWESRPKAGGVKEYAEKIFDPLVSKQNINFPARLESVDTYIDSRLNNPDLMAMNPELMEEAQHWGVNNYLRSKSAAIADLKKGWLKKVQKSHNEINEYNFKYLDEFYDRFPSFQSAMMRANLYGRTKIDQREPIKFRGDALSEVAEKFVAGEYASLKHMKKDYDDWHKIKTDEEEAREKDRSNRIPSVEEGEWVELKQVPENATPEQEERIYDRWKAYSNKGWCTKGKLMTETYANEGPMYVLMKDNIPTIAVRYEGNQIAEIRSPSNNNHVPLKYIPDIKEFIQGMEKIEPSKMGAQSKLVFENAEIDAEIRGKIEDKIKKVGKKKDKLADWEPVEPLHKDDYERSAWYDYVPLENGGYAVTGWRAKDRFDPSILPSKKDYEIDILTDDIEWHTYQRGVSGGSQRMQNAVLTRYWPVDIKEIAGEATLSGITMENLHTIYGEFNGGENIRSIEQIDRKGMTAEEARLELEKIKAEYEAKGLLKKPSDIWGFTEAEQELVKRVDQITYLPALMDIKEGVVTLGWNISLPSLWTLPTRLNLRGDADIPMLEYVDSLNVENYGAHAPALKRIEEQFKWNVLDSADGRPFPLKKSEVPKFDFNKLEEVGGDVLLASHWFDTNKKKQSPDGLKFGSLHDIGGSLILADSNPNFPKLYSVMGNVGLKFTDMAIEKRGQYRNFTKNPVQKRLYAPNLTYVGRDIIIREHDYLPNLQRVGGNIHLYIDGSLEQAQETLKSLDKQNFLPNLTHVGGRFIIHIPEADYDISENFPTRYLHPGGRISAIDWTQLIKSEKIDSDFTGYADKNNFYQRKYTGEISKSGERLLRKEDEHVDSLEYDSGYWPPTKKEKDRIKEYLGNFKPSGIALGHKGIQVIISNFPNIAPNLKWVLNDLSNPVSGAGGTPTGNTPQINYSQSRWFSPVWEGTEFDPRITKVFPRYSKITKAISKEELEAEWRRKTKGKPASELPKKKQPKGDKVTLSKEARIRASKRTGETIKVKAITIRPAVSRALERIRALGVENPYNSREILIGKTAIEIEPEFDGKSLWYKDIRATEKGKGHATKTMKLVQNIAREEGINLTSVVQPFEDAPMTKAQLTKWYKKLGWEDGDWVGEIIYRGEPEEILVLSDKMITVPLDAESKSILKSKPTRKDLTPEAILNPRGNVRSSKVLMSRVAKHAIDTRSWNPFTRWTQATQPFADRLTKRLVSQGTLPDSAQYKALRRRVKGIITSAETAGKKLYDALKKSKQKELIFKYLTTKDFDPNQISNLNERQAAISAKKRINEIGNMLVERKLMKKKTKELHEGEYLPRVYLKYLLGEENFRKASTKGGLGLDMSYLIGRKDIPEGIRKLILGEIQDPGYLASKAVAVPQKDIAIIDWLKSIAGNKNWVLPTSLVQYDVLGKMKSLTASVDLQKQLELVDTEGSPVSAYWLANESDRILNQTKLLDLSDAEHRIVTDLTKDMTEKAQAQMEKTQGKIDPKLYSQVPATPKYGQLAGMVVRKEIAQDIFGSMNMATGDISLAESVFGDGGKIGDYNRLWKWSKVSANPPSWVRNFISNLTLMNLGDVPFYRMPGLMLSSLADMRKMGKHGGKLHQLSKDLGLTAGNFSNAELGRIEKEFKDLMQRMSAKEKSGMRVLGPIKGAFNVLRDSTSDFYGGIDSLGKMMMLKYKMEKAGLKIKDYGAYSDAELAKLNDAAYDAEKYLFDYSNPLPSVKWVRQAPFGAPFMSFVSFVLPIVMETVITKPWKFLPYYVLGWSAKELFKEMHDLDEEKYKGLRVSMSDYLREKAEGAGPYPVIPWPYLDANGRVQFIDVSYLYPWGMFSEVLGEMFDGNFGKAMRTAGLMGSPTLTVASAIMSGRDSFTRQPIVDDFGTWDEQAADIGWFAFNLTMPPMLHGVGQGPGQGYGAWKRVYEAVTGQLTKEGEARFTLPQATARLGGINITPIAVPEGRNKQLRYEYSRLQKLQRLAKRDLTNMIIMQEDAEDIREAALDYREKIQNLANEFKERVGKSAPPITLLRQREQALKKMRERLQQKKAS